MKSIVLLSAGLDSTVNLYQSLRHTDILKVLTFDYGQRAAAREIEKSTTLCQSLNLNHEVIELPWLKSITSTSLVSEAMNIPVGESVSIDDPTQSEATAKAVWVPNRNGVFLNIAASYAEALGADVVVPGFNLEEATTFADNSKEYLAALDQSFSFSTRAGVRTHCFTTDLNKTEIYRLGEELGVNFDLVWPCYFSGEELCGECESCLRFTRAKNAN